MALLNRLVPGTDLAPPFGDWQVAVERVGHDERILSLSFDSPMLGRRTRNLVWLPDGYGKAGEAWPVVYHLHGTVAVGTHPLVERLTGWLVDRGIDVGWPLRPPRDAVIDPDTMGFDESLGEHRFIVVAPDAGAPPWCVACNWVDGVRAAGVPAESHLYSELFPLVEELFRAQTDRGGRAVIGHSMGGGGAMIQGFRHPDRFAFVGSSSGTLSVMDDLVSRTGLRWLLYNRSQGFRRIRHDEIRYRNINLLDLTPNVAGSGLEIVVVVGDGTATGEVRPRNPLSPGQDRQVEIRQRHNNDLVAGRLTQLGVPFTYVQRAGLHSIGASTFREHFLERLNATFDRGVEDPATFAYKSVDRVFSVWGYAVSVNRPNHEFLHLLRARRDGRDFTLAGTGDVRIDTPAAFDPGKPYWVTVTPAGSRPEERRLTADRSGRLTVELRLGPARLDDERRVDVEAGRFRFPQSRVEIDNRTTGGAVP